MSQRAMIASTAEQGGYLIGRQLVGLGHALFALDRPSRRRARVRRPVIGQCARSANRHERPTYWPGELGTGTASDPVFEQVEASPKTLVGLTMISNQLLRQAPGVADAMLANNLLGVVAAKLDEACLVGTGGAMPTGVLGVSGITLTTGTAFDHAAACAMLKAVSDANADDARVRYLGAPAVRELLPPRQTRRTVGLRFT